MAFDAHKNFAYSTVQAPPNPNTSATSLTVQSGTGSLFPTPPFNATVWPANSSSVTTNAEVVRVTAISGDVFTIIRAQEGSSVQGIGVGYQIANTATNKVFTDIESAVVSGGTPATLTTAGLVNQTVFNVRNYGAQGNTKIISDGAMTTGISVLTSSSANFTLSDQGKNIVVRGALGTNLNLYTTILSYTSPTQVTLNATATTSVSGSIFVYGTNDSGAFSSAFTAAAAAKGTVFVPPGMYFSTGNILPASNTQIVGSGYGSVLIPTHSANLNISNVSKITVSNLRVDGSAQQNNGDRVMNIGSNAASTTSGILVDNIDITNAYGGGLWTTADAGGTTDRVTIRNCRGYGLGSADVFGGGADVSTSSIIQNLTVSGVIARQDATQGNGYTNAIDIVGVYRSQFINNETYGGVLFGSEQAPHHHSNISGNIIKPAIGAAYGSLSIIVGSSLTNPGDALIVSNNNLESSYILVNSSITPPPYLTNVVVANNVLDASNIPTGTASAALTLGQVAYGLVANNVVYNSAAVGIWLNSCNNCSVSDCIVQNPTSFSLQVNNNSNNNFFTNNAVSGGTGVNFAQTLNTSFFNTLNVNPQFAANIANPVSGSVTIRRSNGNVSFFVLGGNTTFTITNGQVKGDYLAIVITQDATGGHTVTWSGTNIQWSGAGPLVPQTAANATDTIELAWDGTNWREKERSLPQNISTLATPTFTGIKIITGSNARIGTGTFTSGTTTISTTAVTSSSLIFFTPTSKSANSGIPTVGTITAGTSFVVNSTNSSDANTFNWWIIN